MSEQKERILVVDDDSVARKVVQRNLTSKDYHVIAAPSVAAAIQILDTTPVDLVITDLKMPKVGGIDLIRHIRANFEDTAVIMITGYASIETAVAAVKEGAEDYLPKPFTDEELFAAVQKALDQLHIRRSTRADVTEEPGALFDLIGESEAMRRVRRAISKAAGTTATVLITGESGTGKELVARAIHYTSPRAAAPFVPVNCAGIPDGLVESELFGHVKGAFTGALMTRAGFFITANGGTIFLDEIAELTLATQAKLLRVFEDNQVQMVGASRPREVDVRVIAATNKDLASLVRKESFRDDLFFRLNVLTIDIPPLRERDDDVLHLLRYFTSKCAQEADRPALQFSDRVLDVLRSYRWPGNVRELQNLIQRLVVLNEGSSIDVSDLPSLMRFSVQSGKEVARTLAEAEADHIRTVLASVSGNKTQAAQILDISRKTLRDKLQRYSLGPQAE
ncbi:MAG: sigma-54-dependent Fis family transcriptional regulator [Phycisphaerales bacterium]|nr:MAG: sigma-54-dependent Fis family transcriptional regulator [Phycisphaerales bacterium]